MSLPIDSSYRRRKLWLQQAVFALFRVLSYAVVAGHEVNGVDQAVVDRADLCLEIPQEGTKHSLNVAVSTALAIWQFYLHLR